MHIYDTSSLQVLRHARAHANNTYGQVVIDQEAMASRRFALEDVGTRLKVLSVVPSTHTDKFGGTSASMMVEVLGVGLIEPSNVLEKMPFMTVECSNDDCLLSEPVEAVDEPLDEAAAALAEAAALCESLEDVNSFRGPLTKAKLAMPLPEGESRDDWSVPACVERVLQLRGEDEVDEASRLVLSALASTVHLHGTRRLDAMRLAKAGNAKELVRFVCDAVDEEAKRRLAKKALRGLTDESGTEGEAQA